jgi:hypothetical protein
MENRRVLAHRRRRMLAAALALALAADPAAATTVAPAANACASSAECARVHGHGSVCESGRCAPYYDRYDLLEMIGMKKKSGVIEPWRLYPSIIPSIGYTPQNGVVLGVTSLAGIYLGDPGRTTISSLGLVALYTSKNQVILMARENALTDANAWQLLGDYRLLLTNQPTYGLGSSSTQEGTGASVGGLGYTATVTGAQPMDFNLVRLHQAVLRRVAGPFYLGASYRLDRYYAIVDQLLDLGASPPVVTDHHAYSRQFGFGERAYGASGVGLEVLYDTRDSTISAYKGWYLSGSFRTYPTWLGSTQDATFVQAEARTYVGLSSDVPRNVLAFWLLGAGVTSGRMPYLTLPSIGWDYGNRSGRGYIQGRFRGDAEVYGEAEWRFRITSDGFLGGNVFANASTFSRPALSGQGITESEEKLFATIRPAGGFGLRFMMNREARNAVTVDLGFGQDSFGIYFGAGEVF